MFRRKIKMFFVTLWDEFFATGAAKQKCQTVNWVPRSLRFILTTKDVLDASLRYRHTLSMVFFYTGANFVVRYSNLGACRILPSKHTHILDCFSKTQLTNTKLGKYRHLSFGYLYQKLMIMSSETFSTFPIVKLYYNQLTWLIILWFCKAKTSLFWITKRAKESFMFKITFCEIENTTSFIF